MVHAVNQTREALKSRLDSAIAAAYLYPSGYQGEKEPQGEWDGPQVEWGVIQARAGESCVQCIEWGVIQARVGESCVQCIVLD